MEEMAAWIHDAYYVYTSKGRTRVDPLKPEMIQMAMTAVVKGFLLFYLPFLILLAHSPGNIRFYIEMC